MKAIILAAGLGTRLRPYTEIIPKPLFPIAGRPLLDRMISQLLKADCSAIIVNTHHLSSQIDAFISQQRYPLPVTTRYEPEILGTGGAIKNAADFWDERSFIAVNSDIVTDIRLKEVYRYHSTHNHPATLVLCDDEEFNTVGVDSENFIISFDRGDPLPGERKKLTFTGIQVLDPAILDYIPENTPCSIIDIYTKLMAAGEKIKAYLPRNYCWDDIGTPERYMRVAVEAVKPVAFEKAFARYKGQKIDQVKLAGDGSDRVWYRLRSGNDSLIMAAHGLKTQNRTSEIDSFLALGTHLFRAGIPVPKIYHADTFAGLVFMEDLGDLNLQTQTRRAENSEEIISAYRAVIDILLKMSRQGAIGFDPGWTYQTDLYSKDFVIENECRYFIEAFVNGFLKRPVAFEPLAAEFDGLAHRAVGFGEIGFMHRDFQSRNIMVRGNKHYLIDFQGGRIGPLQYDLASLLIDPYVALPQAIQAHLLDYCGGRLSELGPVEKKSFYRGYQYCAVTRNLQILGAFGFLSRVKGKTVFEEYIPAAVKSLKQNFKAVETGEFPKLSALIENL